MSLTIAARLRPYSHRLGVCAPIPLSNLFCQCYPTLWKIALIGQKTGQGLELQFQPPSTNPGPSSGFTVALDLERPGLLIWQNTPSGFQKLRLHVDHEGLLLTALRGGVSALINGATVTLQSKESVLLMPKERFTCALDTPFERLSLGSHTAQEIVPFSVKRDLFALLPMWMRLGALMPSKTPLYSGTAALLQKMAFNPHESQAGKAYEENLHTLLRTGFFDLFMPRLTDNEYQGDGFPPPDPLEDPCVLLTEGSKRLRAAFLQTVGSTLHILPQLPSIFHAGRLLDAACGEMGTLSFEWTKRCIRQMRFTAKQDGSLRLKLPAEIRRFRLRYGGTSHRTCYAADTELFFCLGQNLFFDRFEH